MKKDTAREIYSNRSNAFHAHAFASLCNRISDNIQKLEDEAQVQAYENGQGLDEDYRNR